MGSPGVQWPPLTVVPMCRELTARLMGDVSPMSACNSTLTPACGRCVSWRALYWRQQLFHVFSEQRLRQSTGRRGGLREGEGPQSCSSSSSMTEQMSGDLLTFDILILIVCKVPTWILGLAVLLIKSYLSLIKMLSPSWTDSWKMAAIKRVNEDKTK